MLCTLHCLYDLLAKIIKDDPDHALLRLKAPCSSAHLLIVGFIKQSILPGGEFHEGGARPDKEAEAALSSSSA